MNFKRHSKYETPETLIGINAFVHSLNKLVIGMKPHKLKVVGIICNDNTVQNSVMIDVYIENVRTAGQNNPYKRLDFNIDFQANKLWELKSCAHGHSIVYAQKSIWQSQTQTLDQKGVLWQVRICDPMKYGF